jgi:hypothetical protein
MKEPLDVFLCEPCELYRLQGAGVRKTQKIEDISHTERAETTEGLKQNHVFALLCFLYASGEALRLCSGQTKT